MQFVQSIYELVAEYEVRACDDRRVISDARNDASSLKKHLDTNSALEKMVEEMKRKHEKEMDLSAARVQRLEKENVKLKEDLS